MLFLGARMVSIGSDEDQMTDSHLGVFKIYRDVVKAAVLNHNIYALVWSNCVNYYGLQ
jgi:hypothetical protein